MTISQTNVVFLRWGRGGSTKPIITVLNSFFSGNQASCNRKGKMTHTYCKTFERKRTQLTIRVCKGYQTRSMLSKFYIWYFHSTHYFHVRNKCVSGSFFTESFDEKPRGIKWYFFGWFFQRDIQFCIVKGKNTFFQNSLGTFKISRDKR